MDANGEAERSATFNWTDPRVGLEHLSRLSGLDYLTGMRDGTIPRPPMASLMNLALVGVEPGSAISAPSPSSTECSGPKVP